MPPKKKTSFFQSKGAKVFIKVLGILGACASGLYSTYMLMWKPTSLRWAIVYFYVSLFALMIVSAELSLLNHPVLRKFGMFLTTYTGRAAFYIFIGGLLLDGYGYIPGIYMLALGVLNVAAQCAFKDDAEAQTSSMVVASTPAPI